MTHTASAGATIDDSVRRIRAEYLEMPGLHLTKPQMQRLCGVDPLTCDALLAALVDVKFLRCTRHGAYVRADRD